jgi:hypothetical protein
MLSVERCKEILGSECPMTDQEVESLRDQLRVLAQTVIESVLENSSATQL